MVETFDDVLSWLLGGLGISPDLKCLQKLNRGHRPLRSHEYVSESWYQEIEDECEAVLKKFFSHSMSSTSEVFEKFKATS